MEDKVAVVAVAAAAGRVVAAAAAGTPVEAAGTPVEAAGTLVEAADTPVEARSLEARHGRGNGIPRYRCHRATSTHHVNEQSNGDRSITHTASLLSLQPSQCFVHAIYFGTSPHY